MTQRLSAARAHSWHVRVRATRPRLTRWNGPLPRRSRRTTLRLEAMRTTPPGANGSFINHVTGDSIMTLCPVALALGCEKCAAFSICPLKTVIGDQKKPPETTAPRASHVTDRDPK